MRTVIQRVKEARVRAKDRDVRIGRGFLVFLGIHKSDTEEGIAKMARKILRLRIFEREEDRMDLSLEDVKGSLLLVSQFTLYGDCSKGNRPGFSEAADPEKALYFYNRMAELLKKEGVNIKTGSFGEKMEVSLVNDGPVTMIIEL